MDKAQQKILKTPSKGDELFGKLVPWIAILGTIAFFIGAGSGAYSPDDVFPMLFGFVIMGTILVAIGALVVAIFNRLVGFISGKK